MTRIAAVKCIVNIVATCRDIESERLRIDLSHPDFGQSDKLGIYPARAFIKPAFEVTYFGFPTFKTGLSEDTTIRSCAGPARNVTGLGFRDFRSELVNDASKILCRKDVTGSQLMVAVNPPLSKTGILKQSPPPIVSQIVDRLCIPTSRVVRP